VAIHREITQRSNDFLADALGKGTFKHAKPEILHVKRFSQGGAKPPANDSKTLVLLHGWMGDREEWDDAAKILAQSLPSEWSIVSVDLPGHGESTLGYLSKLQSVNIALGLNDDRDDIEYSGTMYAFKCFRKGKPK
jgi:pimeloyl-ACP methyl ester carboxylesterase